MKKIILLIFTIALISKTSQSNAAGLILGATLDLPKNFFVGADAFANYYDED
ncbi:MAG: putative membrane protein, partial [Rickettsiales bacterium]